MPKTTSTTPTANARRARLDAAFGPPETKQLNARVDKGLIDNVNLVAKLTGESVADIVTDAVQRAVDERLAQPEIKVKLEALLARSRRATAA